MSQVEVKSHPQITKADREIAWSPDPIAHATPRRRRPILALLITFGAVALAVGLGSAMWDAYMGAPWTRDGTVRVYVVTMAPEVAGRVVKLPGVRLVQGMTATVQIGAMEAGKTL